jgi:hypothetical protein
MRCAEHRACVVPHYPAGTWRACKLPPAETFRPSMSSFAGAEASVAWIVWNNTLLAYFGSSSSRHGAFAKSSGIRDHLCRLRVPADAPHWKGGSYTAFVNGRWSRCRAASCDLAGVACCDRGRTGATHARAEVPEVRMYGCDEPRSWRSSTPGTRRTARTGSPTW